MLGIAKKIYNGVTDQRVFRLLVLVSMFFAYMELTTQSEKIQNAVRALRGIEYDTGRYLSSIEDEAEEIRKISSRINAHAEGIEWNTN